SAPPTTPTMGPTTLLPSRAPCCRSWATCERSVTGTPATNAHKTSAATAPAMKRNRDDARAIGSGLIIISSPWSNHQTGGCRAFGGNLLGTEIIVTCLNSSTAGAALFPAGKHLPREQVIQSA